MADLWELCADVWCFSRAVASSIGCKKKPKKNPTHPSYQCVLWLDAGVFLWRGWGVNWLLCPAWNGLFTCSDDFLDLHAGDVDLAGELVHRLVGVLVSERVDVDFHTRGHCRTKGEGSINAANLFSFFNFFFYNLAIVIIASHKQVVFQCLKLALSQRKRKREEGVGRSACCHVANPALLTILLQFLGVLQLGARALLPETRPKAFTVWSRTTFAPNEHAASRALCGTVRHWFHTAAREFWITGTMSVVARDCLIFPPQT